MAEIHYDRIDNTPLPFYPEDSTNDEDIFQDTLATIMEEITTLKHKAEDMILALRIRESSLPKSPTLRDAMSAWLKKQYSVGKLGPPTWRLLVSKVAEDTGGADRALAIRIAERHPMGSVSTVPKRVSISNVTATATQETYEGGDLSPMSTGSAWSTPASTPSNDSKLVFSRQQHSFPEEEEDGGRHSESAPPTYNSSISKSSVHSGKEENRSDEEDSVPAGFSHQVSDEASLHPPNYQPNSQNYIVGSSGFSSTSTGFSTNTSATTYSVPETAVQHEPGQDEATSIADDGRGNKKGAVIKPMPLVSQPLPGHLPLAHPNPLMGSSHLPPAPPRQSHPPLPPSQYQPPVALPPSKPVQQAPLKSQPPPPLPPQSQLPQQVPPKSQPPPAQAPQSQPPLAPPPQSQLPPPAPPKVYGPLQPYKMPKEGGYHGHALIINNINIVGRDKRLGAEKDDENLTQTFNTLGYRCHSYRDKTAEEMNHLIIGMLTNTDHKQCDSFVLCLLSHGDSGKIFGSDDKPLYIDKIKEAVINCPSLVGKPKIFILQACRGGYLPGARAIQSDDDTSTTNRILLPEESDLFFGYATTPHTKACRFTDIGSWYIIELCQALNSYYKELDLLSMVQLAHYEVATKDDYIYDVYQRTKDGQTVLKKYKQSPQMVSTLIRPVRF